MRTLKKYISAGNIFLQTGMQYRLNTFFLLSIVIVPPVAYFFLWKSIYSEKEIIGAYTLSQIVTYYIISNLFKEMHPRAPWEIALSIKDGKISLYLTKPINHLLMHIFMAYSHIIMWWIFAISASIFLFIIFKNYVVLPTNFSPFFLAFFFSLLGGILNYLFEYIFNLLAFWIERPFGIMRFYDFVVYFFAGAIIPLDLLPYKNFFLSLPFKYISYFPSAIFVGRIKEINILMELSVIIFWIFTMVIISQVVFYFGRKYYSAPGST